MSTPFQAYAPERRLVGMSNRGRNARGSAVQAPGSAALLKGPGGPDAAGVSGAMPLKQMGFMGAPMGNAQGVIQKIFGGQPEPQAAPWMGSALHQGPPMLGQTPFGMPQNPVQPQGPAPAQAPAQQPAGQQSDPVEAPRFDPMSVFKRPQAAGLDPNMKAIMDAMTGQRVHKGMDGRQLGQEGVNPNLKYMLYAMRGRRHKGMRGEDIY